MAAYYSEWDPFAAEWLRDLIKQGLIADGDVDERSIADVSPADLRSFDQCHFFAGIGGWSYALRLAGWPDDRPVWTGSCPCQPFSVAGRGKGVADERHLWPEFYRLIRECRPAIVFGEQVASRAGREWFAGVRSDLERVGYGAAAADLCAAGVGAPHIRQRLYWVATDMAHANMREPKQFEGDGARPGEAVGGRSCAQSTGRGQLVSGNMADADCGGRESREPAGSIQECLPKSGCNKRGDMANSEGQREPSGPDECSINSGCRFIVDGAEPWSDGLNDGKSVFGNVANSDDARRQGWGVLSERADERSPWSHGVEWRRGADGKARRVKPGVRLLANGSAGGMALERTLPSGETETHIYSRVGALRGFGNAIVPQLAAEFIRAAIEFPVVIDRPAGDVCDNGRATLNLEKPSRETHSHIIA